MTGRYRPDTIRIDEMEDWSPAQAREVCDICGCRYDEHAPVPGFPRMHRLCDGALVRL